MIKEYQSHYNVNDLRSNINILLFKVKTRFIYQTEAILDISLKRKKNSDSDNT